MKKAIKNFWTSTSQGSGQTVSVNVSHSATHFQDSEAYFSHSFLLCKELQRSAGTLQRYWGVVTGNDRYSNVYTTNYLSKLCQGRLSWQQEMDVVSEGLYLRKPTWGELEQLSRYSDATYSAVRAWNNNMALVATKLGLFEETRDTYAQRCQNTSSGKEQEKVTAMYHSDVIKTFKAIDEDWTAELWSAKAAVAAFKRINPVPHAALRSATHAPAVKGRRTSTRQGRYRHQFGALTPAVEDEHEDSGR